jgi:tetratricopeptide (TPR) repeat protein/tRNA A-37 threonylcarbamoyl transferase component Bud32
VSEPHHPALTGLPFEILEPLGSGSMGTVYRARQHQLSREVALKVIRMDRTDDEHAQARFRREMQLAARLSHPGLVAVYDGGTAQDVAYIAMELVVGENLQQLLKRHGRFPFRTCLGMAMRLAECLEYLHGLGVLHRDIKPANILVAKSGEVKLADLGVARAPLVTQLTVPGALVGTLQYMAPEMMLDANPTTATDLWALGCVLYQCICAAQPIESNKGTVMEWANRLRHEPIRPLAALVPDVPQPLAAAVMGLLAKDPAARTPSARRLREQLQEIEGESADAILIPGAFAARKDRQRATTRKTVAAPAKPPKPYAIVALLAFLLITVIRWNRLQPPEPDPAGYLHWCAQVRSRHGGVAAEAEAQQLAQLYPQCAVAQFQLLFLLQFRAQTPLHELIQLEKMIMSLAPGSREAQLAEALYFWGNGQAKVALDNLRRATAARPLDPDLQYFQALFAMSLRKPDAGEQVRRSLKVAPTVESVHTLMGDQLQNEGDFVAAEAAHRRAVQLTPSFSESHWRLADFLKARGRNTEADAEYRLAIAAEPGVPVAVGRYAEYHLARNSLEVAERLAHQAVELGPRAAISYVGLVRVLDRREHWAEVDAACAAAEKADPERYAGGSFGQLAVIRARALDRMGQTEAAIALLRAALHQRRNLEATAWNLMRFLNAKNRGGEALRDLELLVKNNPDSAGCHVALGSYFWDRGRLNEARAQFTTAAALEWDNTTILLRLGLILQGMKDLTAAERQYRAGLRLDSRNAELHLHLGDLLQLRQQIAAAREEYTIALRLNPDLKNENNALLMQVRKEVSASK